MAHDIHTLPGGLPAPEDDGRCAHLLGRPIPPVALRATSGAPVTLAGLSGSVVVFAYPRTGRPGQLPLVSHWNQIPGARGCTPQTCGYRDLHAAFAALGTRVFGLSTQTTEYQSEMVQRLRVPFPVLSDAALALTQALSLPTFEVAGHTLLERLGWHATDGVIDQVFYPVFPPNDHARTVLAWRRSQVGLG